MGKETCIYTNTRLLYPLRCFALLVFFTSRPIYTYIYIYIYIYEHGLLLKRWGEMAGRK